MRDFPFRMFIIFALAAGLAGCQLLKTLAPGPSLAERCADEYPCKDTTIHDISYVTDTIVEPYLDTILVTEVVMDTVLGVPITKYDTTYIAKVRTRYVTRTDTVTKYLRVDTARDAADKQRIDALNEHLSRVKTQFKALKDRGVAGLGGLLMAVFGLVAFLFTRKNRTQDEPNS